MTAEDLIKNNSLTDIEITGNQTIVFSEIALTAINMAREEVKCKWEKATAAFVKDAEIKTKKKCEEAFRSVITAVALGQACGEPIDAEAEFRKIMNHI